MQDPSVDGGNGREVLAAAMQIMHGDVEKDFATRRFHTNDHGLSLFAAAQALIVHVNFRGKHFEVKALIVEERHGIADDHVGKLANRFADNLLALGNLLTREVAVNLDGDFGRKIEDDTALNVALMPMSATTPFLRSLSSSMS